MRYFSVCSGIEAASAAWQPTGWECVGLAEIEPFPCHVLTHRFGASRPMFMPRPGEDGITVKTMRSRKAALKAIHKLPEKGTVQNHGDITRFREWTGIPRFDVLVGGTPCQSFSVAGLRQGLADPRGNLMLTYLAIADRYRPEWLVWENVPGVLSADKGRAFGTFIKGLEELGYHAAWRVLDAQYVRVDGFGRAVPQRRRRVFVVGHLGDWRRAAAVLFDRESLSWNSAPRREARERVAGTTGARTKGGGGLGTDFDLDGGTVAMAHGQSGAEITTGHSPSLTCNHEAPIVAHTLSAEGHDASEDGTGRGVPLIAFSAKDYGADAYGETSPTLRAGGSAGGHANGGVMPAVAFQSSQSDVRIGAVHTTLDGNNGSRRHNGTLSGSTVRRLMPIECERLQGFPDDWTNVPYRGKPAADGPRYKAIGNSKAVNVVRWIGRRIEMVNKIGRAD